MVTLHFAPTKAMLNLLRQCLSTQALLSQLCCITLFVRWNPTCVKVPFKGFQFECSVLCQCGGCRKNIVQLYLTKEKAKSKAYKSLTCQRSSDQNVFRQHVYGGFELTEFFIAKSVVVLPLTEHVLILGVVRHLLIKTVFGIRMKPITDLVLVCEGNNNSMSELATG